MIDNFSIIEPLLKFNSEDDFYFVQILKRKKEHKELGSNSYVVKTYFIKSLEDLEFHKPEMICLADFHDARVYINLNKRSFEKMAFHSLKKISDIIMNKDYKSVRSAYNSVCGLYSEKDDKSWIIDIDDVNYNQFEFLSYVQELEPFGDKFIAKIPTKNGYHLIVKPFNLTWISSRFNFEIHKNNPTILYIK